MNKHLMSALTKEYGKDKAEKIYYALEAIQKKKHPGVIPFQHKKQTLQDRIAK